MGIGTHERRLRARVLLAAQDWRASPLRTRKDQHRWNQRLIPIPSEVTFALLFTRLMDARPAMVQAIGAVPTVISVRVPSQPVADLLAEIVSVIVRGDFPRTDGQSSRARRLSRSVSGIAETERRNGGSKNEEARIHVSGGGTLIAFWYQNQGFLPAELTSIRTDAVELPPIDGRVLVWLGLVATGGRCVFPAGFDYKVLAPAQIDVAFAYGLTPTECERRVLTLSPPPPEPASAPTEASEPSLCDMPTFGEASQWGLQLAKDIADYREGTIPWSAVDRGALIQGPPGVGKTLFAKLLAKTCGVELISTSVSEWYSTDHLGETLRLIGDIFHKAAERSPCILFIDEIDGIGNRNNLSDRHRDYFTQIINRLLICMDGIEKREGVVVIGATNFSGQVDPALKRPGRLDRVVRIPLPGAESLEAIYRYHLEADLLDVDLGPLAAISAGSTGADVELFVRAARRRARRAGRTLTLDDLVAQVRERALALPEGVVRRITVHEAGHAIAAVKLGLSKAVTVTIGGRNGKLGTTSFERAEILDTRATFLAMTKYILAGRAAEDVIVGEISGGSGGSADSDLAQATSIITSMEVSFGLGESGSLTWFGEPIEALRLLRDPRMARLVERTLAGLYRETRNLIEAHRDGVERVADALRTRHHVAGSELLALIGESPLEQAPSNPKWRSDRQPDRNASM